MRIKKAIEFISSALDDLDGYGDDVNLELLGNDLNDIKFLLQQQHKENEMIKLLKLEDSFITVDRDGKYCVVASTGFAQIDEFSLLEDFK